MTRFITYTTRHYDKLIQAVLEHFEIVGLTLVISIALAFMIAMLVMEHKRIAAWITRVFSMIYAIPSLALFALLLPVTGLGMQTAVLVLVILQSVYSDPEFYGWLLHPLMQVFWR